MADFQVTCVTPDGSDPDRRIDGLGGLNWYASTDDVIVATRWNGRKYLKTRGDGYEPNNLLSLQACPV